jgi:hypothetical protein
MRRTALLVLIASLAAGCRNAAGPDTIPDGAASIVRLGSLQQTVRVEPAEPVSGQNITVRSVLLNTGSAPIDLSSRLCGLDYAGALALEEPQGYGKCGAYSMQGLLGAGDSLVVVDLMEVSAGPGRHTLRVRHALAPSLWAELRVGVRGP